MRRIALLVGMFLSVAAGADDTLESVMARLAGKNDTTQIRYREVRHLTLMTEDWKATGFLYARPPDSLVKLQLQPSRAIMAISDGCLWYYDVENDVRYHTEVEEGNASSVEIASFMSLVNGDLSELEAIYSLVFASDSSRWVIRLIPHADGMTAGLSDISVSGPVGGPIERITIKKTDGDTSEIHLSEFQSGKIVANTITSLLAEVRGE